jgi:hypothetical protein
VSRWIEDQTGWSVRRFVRTSRRYRTITAADPVPKDLRDTLDRIHRYRGAH